MSSFSCIGGVGIIAAMSITIGVAGAVAEFVAQPHRVGPYSHNLADTGQIHTLDGQRDVSPSTR